MKKTLFSRIFSAMALTAFVPLAAFAAFSAWTAKDLAVRISRYELLETARIASISVRKTLDSGGNVRDALRELSSGTKLRLTVIDRNGMVVYDSEVDPSTLENHGSREEVRDAFEKGSGSAFRSSVSTGAETVYAGVRIGPDAPFVLRVALPLPLVAAEMRAMTLFSVLVLVAILSVAIGFSLFASDRLRRPAQALERTAERWVSGELSARSVIREPLELERLSEIMNTMVSELETRIKAAEKSSEETRAVLDSMAEAVIVTDASGLVISRNPRADEFFLHDGNLSRNGPGTILEYTRNSEITGLESLARLGKSAEGEVSLFGQGVRRLGVTASPLASSGGAVIVSNDLTRILRLETVRKDFVANVSHELKTPIQSIRGFAETLSSGALDDRESAERFVEIIGRHARRMEAIIEDLLALARLERTEDFIDIYRDEVNIQDVIESVIETASYSASRKNIRIVVERNEKATLKGREGLLEQAIFNLVDNALKFSPEDSEVFLSAANTGSAVEILVRDSGPGIPSSDVERIFERFFRVDKSRSRESGGTGLGLAIVKHIAILHKGSISVTSVVGKGSVFTLVIPLSGV